MAETEETPTQAAEEKALKAGQTVSMKLRDIDVEYLNKLAAHHKKKGWNMQDLLRHCVSYTRSNELW